MKYLNIFDKCKTNSGYFGDLRSSNDRYFILPVMESVPGATMRFQGKDRIMWSINNYLGLAENEEIKRVAIETAKKWSISGPMGSRMMSGNTSEHIALENRLAEYSLKESAILFNYGYLGVIGTVASLIEKNDVIVLDKLCHASIVDAARSAVSDIKNIKIFKHNDMESLEKVLQLVNKNRKKGVMVITEGVYGMTGDIAKLDVICTLKDKYEARLFVDDAHGFGVMGAEGRGTGEYLGVQDKIDIYFGTFAKAFAAIGGFSASSKAVIDWIRYNARTQIFAKSLPMIYVKSLEKTLEMVIEGHNRRRKVFDISAKLSNGLREIGFYVAEVKSPIIAVFIPGGDQKIIMQWIKYLRDQGIFVSGVVYPVIPKGMSMFRIVPTASHTDDHVERTLEAFKSLRDSGGMNLKGSLESIARIYS